MTPEIIDIRQLDAADFRPLLEAESEAWGASLRWDYTASAELISACLEEKRLCGYALVEGRRIEGYSFFVYEGDKGLIGDLFIQTGVANGARRDRALLLLEHVIETLTATPGIRRVEAQLPHFTAEELEPCFRAYGFRMYVRRFMALSFRGRPRTEFRPGTEENAREFAIEPWDRKFDPAIAQLLYNAYRHHVDAIINDQYASVSGAGRLVENIVQLRGCGDGVPRASLVAVHRPTRKLAAVLALTTVRPGTAHIPQIAVAPEFQARGLGSALMDVSFREAERQGYREVSLTVTDLNRGAVRLYERIGFETFRTFGAFVWSA